MGKYRSFGAGKKLILRLKCGHSKVVEKGDALGAAQGQRSWCAKCFKESTVTEKSWVRSNQNTDYE